MDQAEKLSCLQKYLEVQKADCEAVLGCAVSTIKVPGLQGDLRLHYVKFDQNGYPVFGELAKALSHNVVNYSLSSRKRNRPTRHQDFQALGQRARALFTKLEGSGEAGELLLYMLVEGLLNAPQVVAKMELKTNSNLELNGTDGIHMRWDATAGVLDIFFGEAKIFKKASAAVKSAFASMADIQVPALRDHEFGLVTSQFKWAGTEVEQAVLALAEKQPLASTCRLNHACLIGFEWSRYRRMFNSQFAPVLADFEKEYCRHISKLSKPIQKAFAKYTHKRHRFEIFVLPFDNVADFRKAFIEYLKR